MNVIDSVLLALAIVAVMILILVLTEIYSQYDARKFDDYLVSQGYYEPYDVRTPRSDNIRKINMALGSSHRRR